MTPLPSFVQLMASLGLESNDGPESRPHHSRSSSHSSIDSAGSQSSSNLSPQPNSRPNSSPSIVISRHSSSTNLARDAESERRRSVTRYSPYSPSISHLRRGSVPSLPTGMDQESSQGPPRALSSSPLPTLNGPTIGRRSSALGLANHARRPEKLATMDADFVANTPISTFVRRRTPQSSPISPTFPHRKRSTSPSAPLLIPTLPTFNFPPLSTINGAEQHSDSDEEDMMCLSPTATNFHTNRHGVSVRRLRASRRSDSNISLGRSSPLECRALEAPRMTPVA